MFHLVQQVLCYKACPRMSEKRTFSSQRAWHAWYVMRCQELSDIRMIWTLNAQVSCVVLFVACWSNSHLHLDIWLLSGIVNWECKFCQSKNHSQALTISLHAFHALLTLHCILQVWNDHWVIVNHAIVWSHNDLDVVQAGVMPIWYQGQASHVMKQIAPLRWTRKLYLNEGHIMPVLLHVQGELLTAYFETWVEVFSNLIMQLAAKSSFCRLHVLNSGHSSMI